MLHLYRFIHVHCRLTFRNHRASVRFSAARAKDQHGPKPGHLQAAAQAAAPSVQRMRRRHGDVLKTPRTMGILGTWHGDAMHDVIPLGRGTCTEQHVSKVAQVCHVNPWAPAKNRTESIRTRATPV